MKQIPYLILTDGQQGGVGYPPVLVKMDRWYAVSDSRKTPKPRGLESFLQKQKLNISYPWKPDPFYHPQTWVYRKWHSAPRLTWVEVLEKCEAGVGS